jgi:hypothetical protein
MACVNFIIKWWYIYRSAHAFMHQPIHSGDTVAEMFRVRWHRFSICWHQWDSLPSRLSSTNHRQPQGLLWQLLRVCMSCLCCALCYVFILNGTIKQWNCFKICDSSLASYQWLFYICPHLIVTDTLYTMGFQMCILHFLHRHTFGQKIVAIIMEWLSCKIFLFIGELIKMVFLATVTVCEVVSQCMDLIFILTKHGHKYENKLHPLYPE